MILWRMKKIRINRLAARNSIKTVAYSVCPITFPSACQSAPETHETLNIAKTEFGLCNIDINKTQSLFLEELEANFPNAELIHESFPETISAEDLMLHKMIDSFNQTSILDLYGTAFQLKVWQALLKIPEGQTTTYADIAKAINKPKAIRAVGTAIGKNPISILIPCHRVLRTDGGIGGYAWGIDIKKKLLEFEMI